MTKTTPSTTYLYFLRVFSILLVILLHCVNPYLTNAALFGGRTWWICNVLNSITRAGVPCFFMMSGFLLLRDPRTLQIGAFYKKRLPRILIPLLVWNVLYFFYYRLMNGQPVDITDLIGEILDFGTAYHLWFVYTIFGIYLLLPFLKRIVDGCTPKQLWWFTLLLFFTGTIRPLLNQFLPVYIHLFEPLAEGYIAFFLLGYLLGSSALDRELRAAVYCGGAAGLLLGVWGNWYFSAPDALNLVFNGGYQINHVLAASALFVFFKQLHWERLPRLCNAAKAWSGRTFGVYFIHVLAMDLCGRFVPAALTPCGVIVWTFLFTVLTSAAAAWLISRTGRFSRLLM